MSYGQQNYKYPYSIDIQVLRTIFQLQIRTINLNSIHKYEGTKLSYSINQYFVPSCYIPIFDTY